MAAIKAKIKINIPAGKATPQPPVGAVLGQAKIPIMPFCNEFNDRTKGMEGIIPAEITVHEDGSYTFILKTPPAASLILKAIKTDKGSGEPNKTKVGKLSKKDLEEIAKIKMPDLNAHSIEQAIKIVAGTARSMGVETDID